MFPNLLLNDKNSCLPAPAIKCTVHLGLGHASASAQQAELLTVLASLALCQNEQGGLRLGLLSKSGMGKSH